MIILSLYQRASRDSSLACMAFGFYEVVRVTCQLLIWFVNYTTEKRGRLRKRSNQSEESQAREKKLLTEYLRTVLVYVFSEHKAQLYAKCILCIYQLILGFYHSFGRRVIRAFHSFIHLCLPLTRNRTTVCAEIYDTLKIIYNILTKLFTRSNV